MNTRKRKRSSQPCNEGEKHNRGDFSETEDALLYGALMKFGPLDIENLKLTVPTRSEYQIKHRILTLQKKAQVSLSTVSKKLRNGAVRLETRDKVALDKWLDRLYILHQKEQIVNTAAEEMPVRMLARIMGYIAKYEEHPDPDECEGVNLKNVYEFVESMLMGLPSKTLPSPDARFLLEGLQKLSTTMDSIDLCRETGFIKCERPEWSVNGKTTRTYGKRKPETSSDEVTPILFSTQYNPFSVPAEWLKRSAEVTEDKIKDSKA